MKNIRKSAGLFLLLLVLVLLPVSAQAATKGTYMMLVGQTGTMSMTSNAVPNAKWKTNKPTVIKVTRKNATTVSVKGLKAGTATLTVYNSKKTSQKYSYTIRVFTPNKLVKNDFIIEGKQIKDFVGKTPYNMFTLFNKYKTKKIYAAFDIRAEGLTTSNTASYMTTYRGIHIFDSYSLVCRMYGKKALKKTTIKDFLYQDNTDSRLRTPTLIKSFKNYWNGQFKYKIVYSYASKYKMHFYFNSSKQLIGVVYTQNY